MITPYKVEEVFAINPNHSLVSCEDSIVVIDDWYKNFDQIEEFIYNQYVSKWKGEAGNSNFKDYYDCRLLLQNNYPEEKFINSIVTIANYAIKYINKDINEVTSTDLQFNYYKNKIKDLPNTIQHSPHQDSEVNCIIYLDNISSGGTAIYDYGVDDINEHENMLYDVTNIPHKVIPAKQNRLVLFDGKRWHGGYIKNHNDYLTEWRINQVMFFR
jgi:uncharacterized protein (UPF0248 family)